MEIKEIPFWKNHYATTDGDILDENKQKVKTFIDSRGYEMVQIRNSNYGVHDTVLRTYVPVPSWIKTRPIANHFDLDKWNNKLSNLDWVDDTWNNIHNILLHNKHPDRPHIKAHGKKEPKYFNTLQEAATFFSVDMRTCWIHLKEGTKIKGYTLEYLKKVHIDVLRHQVNVGLARNPEEYGKQTSASRPVKILNLTTEEVKEYKNMLTAAKAHGVLLTHIRNRLSTPKKPRVFNQNYVIIDSDNTFDFLTPEVRKDLLSRGSKKVIVYDGKEGTFTVYRSASRFINKHSRYKAGKGAITIALKKKGLCCYKEYIIAYLPESEEHNPDCFLICALIKSGQGDAIKTDKEVLPRNNIVKHVTD